MSLTVVEQHRMVDLSLDVELYFDDYTCFRHGLLQYEQRIQCLTLELREINTKIDKRLSIIGSFQPFSHEGSIIVLKFKYQRFPEIVIKLKMVQMENTRYRILTQYVKDEKEGKWYRIKKIGIKYERFIR